MPRPSLPVRPRSDPSSTLPASLRDSLQDYLAAMAARGQSPHTVELKHVHLARFLRWVECEGLVGLEQVTWAVLEQYRQATFRSRRRDGRPLALTTQHQRLVCLRPFFRWLTRTARLATDPSLEFELPMVPAALPAHVPSPRQVQGLVDAIDVTSARGLRDRAVLELLYSSGLRRQELASLQLLDLDLEQGVVFIRRGKGGRSRYIPVGQRAARWITRYLTESRPALVPAGGSDVAFLHDSGEPFIRHRLSDLVRRRMVRVGLTQRGACHLLRHAMATHMLHGGCDIRHLQLILGHADLGTTARYTQVSIRELQRVHARTHPAEMSNAQTAVTDEGSTGHRFY